MSKGLVKYGSKSLMASESTSGAVGKGLAVTGGAGLGLWFVAGLIPFVSLPMLMVFMVIAGLFMWE
jgi:hypothetical protein